jgi:hypothetical protein
MRNQIWVWNLDQHAWTCIKKTNNLDGGITIIVFVIWYLDQYLVSCDVFSYLGFEKTPCQKNICWKKPLTPFLGVETHWLSNMVMQI